MYMFVTYLPVLSVNSYSCRSRVVSDQLTKRIRKEEVVAYCKADIVFWTLHETEKLCVSVRIVAIQAAV